MGILQRSSIQCIKRKGQEHDIENIYCINILRLTAPVTLAQTHSIIKLCGWFEDSGFVEFAKGLRNVKKCVSNFILLIKLLH